MRQTLPSLQPIPDNIEDEIQRLLQDPSQPALENWLYELIKSSGHMSTGEDMRWRVFCTVWLAVEFSVDKAWPYLMWLNMKEATISTSAGSRSTWTAASTTRASTAGNPRFDV